MAFSRFPTRIRMQCFGLMLLLFVLNVYYFVSVTSRSSDISIPADKNYFNLANKPTNSGLSNYQTRLTVDGGSSRPTTRPAELNRIHPLRKPLRLPVRLHGVPQDDETLVKEVASHWIIPPSTLPYNLTKPYLLHYSQEGQSQFVDKYLKRKRNGFFIECGAYDGEAMSNSLFFEKEREWRGLLIEGNPHLVQGIEGRHRHAYTVPTCLSIATTPTKHNFSSSMMGWGGIDSLMSANARSRTKKEGFLELECLPLHTILLALDITHVDYFSLDVEGAEMDILRSIPFDKVHIEVFSIEWLITGEQRGSIKSQEKLKTMVDFLITKGYKQIETTWLDVFMAM